MKIKMTITYGEDFCEDLKEAFGSDTEEEFLGAFKAMITTELMNTPISDKDLSVNIELV